jgi:apolipoprotein N-acyltransferase
MTMWLADVEHPAATVFPDRPAFAALVWLHDRLKPTPLFWAGSWLMVCIVVCGFAWRRRETREGAFALGVCGSAAVYVLSFFAVGVASDFRYGYWAVLAGIAGGVVASRSPPKVRVS